MPPILMIHGMWSRPSTFATLRMELEASGILSAAITLPFHDIAPGAEPPPALAKAKIADYVAAIERAVTELGEPCVLLGHSMGGLLVQRAAEKVQPRGLILLSTAPSAQASALSGAALKTVWSVTNRWGWWNEPTLLGEEAARAGVFNHVPEAEIRPALAELTWDSGRVLAQMAAPWADSEKGSRVDYGRLKQPTLVITGRDDRIVPPDTSRKTARLLGKAGAQVDYEEWPSVGHWLFHDAVRPKLAASISRFMSSLA
ncbi:alpha/beta hydrolase [Sandaracinobacteroides hominis]|uniref:alpha/beta hydrolase n=1 Tax=Sandaracinobacteroides hominis TaxID=2780086 RepID=UPI001F1EF6A3|nr:alpha/beta fold hydrolase [Sandaracinobacteroides hominis]